jgi:hypothetical protein
METWLKRGQVTTFRDIDDQRVCLAFALVVIPQLAAEASCFDAYNRIVGGIVAASSIKNLKSDDILPQVLRTTRNRLFDAVTKEAAQTHRASEWLAKKDLLKLCLNGNFVWKSGRSAHAIRYGTASLVGWLSGSVSVCKLLVFEG